MKEKKTISDLLEGFEEYLSVELRLSPATTNRYTYNIRFFTKLVGDPRVEELDVGHFIKLKRHMGERGAKESRIASMIAAMKSLLRYARDMLKVPVVDLATITVPRAPRRAVVYLTNEELAKFIEAIPLRTFEGRPRLAGYRFRALVETLAATGMRLSEVLSLDRDSIDFSRCRAVIVGKGNKERTVLFTDTALHWITRYLDLRVDRYPALFATSGGARLSSKSVHAAFQRAARFAGLSKPVTPHILRHTMATNLLKNGCPIGFIQHLLGHDRLETTCRYYLGVLSAADAERAYRTYLNYRTEHAPTTPDESKQTPDAQQPSYAEPSPAAGRRFP